MKNYLRALLALAGGLLSVPALAAEPPCYAGPLNPPREIGLIPDAVSVAEIGYIIWRCTETPNLVYWDVYNWTDVAVWRDKAYNGTFTKEEADTYRAANAREVPAAITAYVRTKLIASHGVVPLVTVNKAYRRSKVINAADKYTEYGRIPVGTPCEPKSGTPGSYMRVDRDLVAPNSSLSIKPDTAYAVCG